MKLIKMFQRRGYDKLASLVCFTDISGKCFYVSHTIQAESRPRFDVAWHIAETIKVVSDKVYNQ